MSRAKQGMGVGGGAKREIAGPFTKDSKLGHPIQVPAAGHTKQGVGGIAKRAGATADGVGAGVVFLVPLPNVANAAGGS